MFLAAVQLGLALIDMSGILPDCSAMLDPELIEGKIAAIMKTTLADTSSRVFFALWPSVAESAALNRWQTTLRCGGRVMRPDSLHTTLLFLGNVDVARLEALTLAAEEISADDFDLCFDEVRYWQHNHIVYAAPDVIPEKLQQLVKSLARQLSLHDFQFEQREYQPHVTLLRNAQPCPLPKVPQVVWTVREFVLVQSKSGEYRALAHFPLSVSV